MTSNARDLWPSSGSDAPLVNGDQLRDMWFWPPRYEVEGYDARQVEDLFRRVAAELDAGRPVGPLIEKATFRMRTRARRYDIEAVNWCLGQFLLPPGQPGRTGSDDDPWRDLPVTQLYPGREGRFGSQCEQAWRDFGQLPGTRLWWGRAGTFRKALWTAEQQVLASVWRSSPEIVSAGGRDFIFTSRATHHVMPPRTWDAVGASTAAGRALYQLVDETDIPVLSTDNKFIMFPDQRWLRFLVRGTRQANAIMTAVDQAGNRIARYRIAGRGPRFGWKTLLDLSKSVEIIVNPGWELTDELALALVISARWL
jgi:hypothetical protein